MTAFDCRRIQEHMLAALGGHASEAERLEIEAHLDACERCRSEHKAWAPIRQLKEAEGSPLPAAVRERIRRAALSAAASASVAPAREPSRGWLPMAAVAAAVLVMVTVASWPPSSRIVSGDVEIVGQYRRKIADQDRLRTVTGGEVRLDGPVVQLAAKTEAVWHGAQRALVLERGAVHVEVDPRQHRRFVVETARFRVEVIGTVFDVGLTGVRTSRGHVRVRALDGTLLADVHAGEQWSVPVAASASLAVPGGSGRPPVAPAAPAETRVTAPVTTAAPVRRTSPPRAPAAGPRDDDDTRLGRARSAILRGAGSEARAVLRTLAHPTREQRAEAGALVAESYLIERRYQQAIDEYQSVVDRFAGTPHAESALYAQAQLELEIGRASAAATTLRKYLARYPEGAFADEARARLQMLRSPPE